ILVSIQVRPDLNVKPVVLGKRLPVVGLVPVHCLVPYLGVVTTGTVAEIHDYRHSLQEQGIPHGLMELAHFRAEQFWIIGWRLLMERPGAIRSGQYPGVGPHFFMTDELCPQKLDLFTGDQDAVDSLACGWRRNEIERGEGRVVAMSFPGFRG